MRARLLAGALSAGIALFGAGRSPANAQLSAIFEPFPLAFTSESIYAQHNLHFVLIPSRGGNTVLAWGGIGGGDAIRFAAAISAAHPVSEVQFYSPGGSLYEGMKIGYTIREQKLATRITSGSDCMSACNFMFMGGVVRIVEPSGRFGVHMFSDTSADALLSDLAEPPTSVDEFNDRYPKHSVKRYEVEAWIDETQKKKPDEKVTEKEYFERPDILRYRVDEKVRAIQQDSAQTAADIAIYLVQMRLSLRFLSAFAHQSSYGIHVMSAEELHDFNIVTN